MLEAGHPEAAFYPLGHLADECELVKERRDREAGNLAFMLHAVVSTIPNEKVKSTATKQANRRLTDLIKKLMGN